MLHSIFQMNFNCQSTVLQQKSGSSQTLELTKKLIDMIMAAISLETFKYKIQ